MYFGEIAKLSYKILENILYILLQNIEKAINFIRNLCLMFIKKNDKTMPTIEKASITITDQNRRTYTLHNIVYKILISFLFKTLHDSYSKYFGLTTFSNTTIRKSVLS